MIDVCTNYRKIVDRIHAAAVRVGRNAQDITLLAAAKSQSVESVLAAIAAGVGLIGENYFQEAEEKRKLITEPVEWHMIGHLQRNKAGAAIKIFDVIQTLDSVALALELDKVGKNQGKMVRTFVEVNLGDEASKSGVGPDNVAELLKRVGDLSHVRVEGLMAVPPFKEDPEEVRPYFCTLKNLQVELGRLKIPNVSLDQLSMGMTHDYPIAVEEGATIVRIGTALFGPRKT